MPEDTMLPRMAAMANADVGRVMVFVILSEVESFAWCYNYESILCLVGPPSARNPLIFLRS